MLCGGITLQLMRRRTAVDGGNHGGAVTFLVGGGGSSRSPPAPASPLKFDCKSSVSAACCSHPNLSLLRRARVV